VDSTCNEVVVPSDGLKTPTSNPIEKKTSNVDGIGASATKKAASIVEEHIDTGGDPISPAKHVTKRREIDTASEAKIVGIKTLSTISTAEKSSIVDGIDMSGTKKSVSTAGEQPETGTGPVSPVKPVGKRSASVEGYEAGIGKEAKTVRASRKKASTVDGIAASAKQKSAITARDVDTPKEDNMSCVKAEGSK
jgi:hypothetical protein